CTGANPHKRLRDIGAKLRRCHCASAIPCETDSEVGHDDKSTRDRYVVQCTIKHVAHSIGRQIFEHPSALFYRLSVCESPVDNSHTLFCESAQRTALLESTEQFFVDDEVLHIGILTYSL